MAPVKSKSANTPPPAIAARHMRDFWGSELPLATAKLARLRAFSPALPASPWAFPTQKQGEINQRPDGTLPDNKMRMTANPGNGSNLNPVLINYANLSLHGEAGGAIRDVGSQLTPYRHYLRNGKRAAERNKLVLAGRFPDDQEAANLQAARLKRRGGNRKASASAEREGCWVILEALSERPEEPEETFDAFLRTKAVCDSDRCERSSEIRRLDSNVEYRALLLEQQPRTEEPGSESDSDSPPRLLWLRRDTTGLKRQLDAVQALYDNPLRRQTPLLELMVREASWPRLRSSELEESAWVFLRPQAGGQPLRDGTDEQREFVEMALATHDFALLEGPPGSGKTTAICELVMQMVRRGQRVLLVASTHVAVDNVLRRLLDEQDALESGQKSILPVRIGDEEKVTDDVVEPWILSRLLATWRERLSTFLESPGEVDPRGAAARRILSEALRSGAADGQSALANLILESSNLVCGTTIGILRHPAIKAGQCEPFDLMIIDEASKTTFTEFLVPALHAKRWVIVGDLRQLSPFVEDQHILDNLQDLLPAVQAAAAYQAFEGARRARLVVVQDEPHREHLRAECESRGIRCLDLDTANPAEPQFGLLSAAIIFGSPDALRRFQHRLPLGLINNCGLAADLMMDWQAARAAQPKRERRSSDDGQETSWAKEVAWRLARSYELRQNPEEERKLRAEIRDLMPRSLSEGWFDFRRIKLERWNGVPKDAATELNREIQTLQRCAMPSILELLQCGFERLEGCAPTVALRNGLPPDALKARLVSLSYQHRGHPDLTAFSRDQFYSQDTSRVLLRDASDMQAKRAWGYRRYVRRAVWLEVKPQSGGGMPARKKNENPAEAEEVLEELKAFVAWAGTEARRDGQPWEVAILTYYKAQETLLRRKLQKLSGMHGRTRTFKLPAGSSFVDVTLCTVDRFQGHEADVVFLSFVNSGRVGFLNSPNRLNVALTRARYQIVLIGDRTYFASDRCMSPLLRSLAGSSHYCSHIAY